MLFDRGRLRACYEDIKAAAKEANGGCSVLLLVAADADAICAARILGTFLRSDGVDFTINPVSGNTDIRTAVESAEESLRTVIMLNCGGSADLKEMLDMQPGMVIYVMDSHLPYYHGNVNDNEKIVILDWSGDSSGVPTDSDGRIAERYDNQDFPESDDEGSDDDDDDAVDEEEEELLDDGADDGAGAGVSPGRRSAAGGADGVAASSAGRKRSSSEAAAESGGRTPARSGAGAASAGKRTTPRSRAAGEDAEEAASDNDGGASVASGSDAGAGRKAKRLRRVGDRAGPDAPGASAAAAPAAEKEDDAELEDLDEDELLAMDDETGRRARRRLRAVVSKYRAYYEKQRFGWPVCLLLHELAEQLNRLRNDILWLACVGCTAPLVAETMSRHAYTEVFAVLKASVVMRNGDGIRPIDPETGDVVHAGRDGFIGITEEPRFILYRHWSLYEAMQYSDYVATRLCINLDDRGASMLDRLLAKTGVPAKVCKQAYAHMLSDERQRFMHRLRTLLAEDDQWHMPPDELFFPSFERHVEREAARSAPDVVLSINGLLAAGNVAPAVIDALIAGSGGSAGAGSSGSGSGGSGSRSGGDDGAGGRGPFGLPPSSGSPGSGRAGVLSSVRDLAGAASVTWRDNFLKAFDSLSRKHSDVFELGIAYAKSLRHSIARVAPAVRRAGTVSRTAAVRLIKVDEELTDAERRLFTHPIALADLGRMLIRMYRDAFLDWRNRKGRVDPKPLVLTLELGSAAEGLLGASGKGAWSGADDGGLEREGVPGGGAGSAVSPGAFTIVMGLPVAVRDGADAQTNFFDAFRQAADMSRSRYLFDSFDSSLLIIHKGDLNRFLYTLDPELVASPGGKSMALAGAKAYGGGSALAAAVQQMVR